MNIKKFLPYIVAIVIFAVITLIQFAPLMSGKVLEQGDIIRYRGMSQEVTEYRKANHVEPLWTNSMFGGMPAYQVSTLYPNNWMGSIDKAFHLFLPHPSGYIFLCFLGFFILLLCLKVDPWLALIGSLAYGFSSYFFIILEAGHNSKANAIGYVAPLLGGIILLMRGKYWLGFSMTTLFMALELNANHVQITYYAFMLFGIVLLSYLIAAIREKNLKPYFIGVGLLIASTVIGILPNAGNLLATNEYGKYTTRGASELTINAQGTSNADNKTSGLDKSYATQWSYGIGETFTFLIPNYKGGPSSAIANADKEALKKVDPQMRDQVGGTNAYFGDQPFTSGPVYIGAIVVLLAFLGLFIIDHKLKWPLFAATLLSVMLSWGYHFSGLSDFFMDHVPGYNKFRAVSMILVIAELTIPLLAVLALDQFIKSVNSNGSPKVTLPLLKKEVDLKKILIVTVAVVGGFCLLGAFMPNSVNSFTAQNEEAQIANQFKKGGYSDQQIAEILPEYMKNVEIAREDIFKNDARRSLIFVALASLFLFLFLLKKLKAEMLYVCLAIFMLADLWPVAGRYLNSKNFVSKASYDAPPEKSGADEHILADKSLDYRVLNLAVSPWNDASTSYYHKSIGGYHGAKLKKYQEIIDFHLDREIDQFYKELNVSAGSDSLMNVMFSKMGVINMLNTRYIMIPSKDQLIPLQNPQANGNAWFVRHVKEVANADEEITGLGKINTKTEAIIQQKNKEGVDVKAQYDGNGSIKLTSYRPNDLVYETQAASPQFAVFSEIYYPKGWNAYVDGTLQNHTCVDYVLRGMNVPAGKHTIEFKFEPAVYKTGNTIALLGSILLLLTVGGSLFMVYKKEKTSLAAA